MRTLVMLAAVVGLALLFPQTVKAQCGAECQRLIKGGQPVGHGCVVATGNNQECLASVSGCQLSPCFIASLITDSGGTLFASVAGCDGKRTPRPVADVGRKKPAVKPVDFAPALAVSTGTSNNASSAHGRSE